MAKEKQRKRPDRPLSRTPRTQRVQSGDESKEMLTEWWHDNGKYFLAGAILGIMAIGGWKGWGYYTETRAIGAAKQYEEMMDHIALEDEQEATQILNTLRDKYAATTYSAFASFAMAKFKTDQGQLEEAAADLRWVTDHAKYEELKSLAWVRLARVLLELGQTEEAKEIVLTYTFPRGVEELAAEVYGDYSVHQSNYEQAQEAYQNAISTSMVDDYNFIMMKVEEIGGTLDPPEDEDEEGDEEE